MYFGIYWGKRQWKSGQFAKFFLESLEREESETVHKAESESKLDLDLDLKPEFPTRAEF